MASLGVKNLGGERLLSRTLTVQRNKHGMDGMDGSSNEYEAGDPSRTAWRLGTARLGCCFAYPRLQPWPVPLVTFPSFLLSSAAGSLFLSNPPLLGQCPEYIPTCSAFSHFQLSSTHNFAFSLYSNPKCFSQSGPSLHARRPS